MATRTRKTILQNPLDEISKLAKRSDSAVRVIDQDVDSQMKSRSAPKRSEQTTVKKITTTNQSSKRVKRALNVEAAVQGKAKTPVSAVKKSAKVSKVTQAEPAKRSKASIDAAQLLTEELAGTSATSGNRGEEIVIDPNTPVKVLEQSTVPSSPAAAHTMPVQFLTAEDIFQSELSRARISVKAELTRTRLSAQKIVKRWARWSVAVSLIPTPFVDMAAISGVQVKMIYELCKQYGVDFEHKSALAIASGVAGGAATKTLAGVLAKQLVRFAPGIGPVFMLAVEPAISYVTTQAMGAAFISHFEADGRLHDFNPERIRQYMAAQIEKRKLKFKEKAAHGQA